MGMILQGPFQSAAGGGGGFPDDTQIFVRSVEQHFTTHNAVTQSNFGYTFPLPAGVKRTGLDRDMFLVIISGATAMSTASDWPVVGEPFSDENPGYDDFGVTQEWRRTVPNNTLLKTTLLRRRPDGTADDFFVIPADYQFHNFSVTFVVFGQNSTTPNMRVAGSHLAGFNADSAQTWDVGSFSWGADFNCFECLYAHKQFTTSTPAEYLGALTLDSIDTTGGFLELLNATDQSQYPNVGDDAQNNQWVQWYGRFLASSPDADSAKARTFTYGPLHGNSPNFASYFRFELGF